MHERGEWFRHIAFGLVVTLIGSFLCGQESVMPPGTERPPEEQLAALLVLEDGRIGDPESWRPFLDPAGPPPLLARALRGLGHVGHPALRGPLREFLVACPTPWPPVIRRAAALATGLLGDPELLVPLSAGASGADLARAVGLVGRLPGEEAAQGQVLRALEKEDEAATSVDGVAGDSVVARLLYGARLKEPLFLPLARQVLAQPASPERLSAALTYLFRHPRPPPSDLSGIVVSFLGSEDSEVAALAARVLARCGDGGERAASLITAAFLDGGPPRVQVERLRALALLPAPPARPALLAGLKHPDPHLRRTALETVAALAPGFPRSDRTGFALFSLAMGDDDPVLDVRRAATLALAASDPASFLRRLPRYRLGTPWVMRAAAAEALKDHAWDRTGIREAVLAFRHDPDRRVQTALLEAAAKRAEEQPSEEERSFLESLLGHGDSGPDDGEGPLLQDRDPVLLGLVARLAGALGEGRPGLLEDLAHLIPAHEVEPLQALIDLAGKSPEGIPLLQRMARGPEIALRRQAAAFLERRGLPIAPHPGMSAQEGQQLLQTCRQRARLMMERGRAEAVVRTQRGDLRLRLFRDEAPATVENFLRLAGMGFFDGLLFHRVVPGFVVQGGCPRGDGWGGPGYTVRCEVNERTYVRGSLGMALAGRDTGGSQWFLCHAPAPHLDMRYTLFGEIVEGIDLLDAMVPGDVILEIRAAP